jgi:hypothetical protein
LALALFLAAPALPAPDCGTSLSVESRTEYYFSASDLLSQVVLDPVLLPIPYLARIGVGSYDLLRSGTNCAQLHFAGLTVTGRCQPQCVPPPPGLVAWWPGEGNANDILGGSNLTMQNGAAASMRGLVGNAFSFDGVDN